MSYLFPFDFERSPVIFSLSSATQGAGHERPTMKTTTRSAMSTATENVTVAQTILAQLGGRRFIAMTGARNLLATDTGLQCKLGSGAQNGITHLRIDLDRGLDLYNVTFLRVRGTSVETVSEHTMIEVSMLRDLFTRETGFYTSL